MPSMMSEKSQYISPKTQMGRQFDIDIRLNSRAKRILLKIDPKTRKPCLIVPNKQQIKAAKAFADTRLDWIAAQMDALPAAQPFEIGAYIPFRGQSTLLQRADSGRFVTYQTGATPALWVPGPALGVAKRVERFLKSEARATLTQASEKYATALGTKFTTLSIRDTKSRWGSCSSRGGLNYSWRLICAPPEVLDYVAAHECAHLLEMNHSAKFWAHVARICPDFAQHRDWLKEHGGALHQVGS